MTPPLLDTWSYDARSVQRLGAGESARQLAGLQGIRIGEQRRLAPARRTRPSEQRAADTARESHHMPAAATSPVAVRLNQDAQEMASPSPGARATPDAVASSAPPGPYCSEGWATSRSRS